MKVIIDTNVVVSAVLKDRTPEDVILFVIRHPEFKWIASSEIVAEYIGVLHRPKFKLPDWLLHKWQNIFEKTISRIDISETIDFPRDQKDAIFLECALVTNAEYLITGDKDLYVSHKLVNTTIVSVSQFKKLICNQWE